MDEINTVSEEDYYEDFVDYEDPETGELVEFSDDSEAAFRISLRNEARKNLLDMLNKNEGLNLRGLKWVPRKDLKNIAYDVLGHAAVCYYYPGIVSFLYFLGKAENGEYIYFI